MSVQMTRTMKTLNGDLVHFKRTLAGWVATFEIGFDIAPRIVHFRKPTSDRKVWDAWIVVPGCGLMSHGVEPLAIGTTMQETFVRVCTGHTAKRRNRFFQLLERD